MTSFLFLPLFKLAHIPLLLYFFLNSRPLLPVTVIAFIYLHAYIRVFLNIISLVPTKSLYVYFLG